MVGRKVISIFIFASAYTMVSFAQISAQPTTNLPSAFPTETNRPITISGRVLQEDGTPLSENVEIQRVCGNVVRHEAYTDAKGKFNILLDSQTTATSAFQGASEGGGAAEMGSQMGNRLSQTTRTQLWGCEIRATFPGFYSGSISLAGRDFSAPLVLNPIVLRRNGAGLSSSISAIALQAPSEAKKEYEKGREEYSKKKLEEADKHLAKAIEIYPKYASAMCLRGKVQRARQLDDQAKASFLAAIQADEKYVPPYLNLAALEASRSKWPEVISLSSKAIELDPASYADAYYFRAVAFLKLNNAKDAQQNLVKVLEMDKEHHFPRAELIMGNMLRAQHDDAGALAHYRNYVQYEPNGADAAKVQEYLRETAQTQPK
jgi:tetratricopeptide (TPR) repeat protein